MIHLKISRFKGGPGAGQKLDDATARVRRQADGQRAAPRRRRFPYRGGMAPAAESGCGRHIAPFHRSSCNTRE